MTNESTQCDHYFPYSRVQDTPMRCKDQGRYLVAQSHDPLAVRAACLAHLAHIVDRLGTDRQHGEYVLLFVRRIDE